MIPNHAVLVGDCIEVLRKSPDASVDSIVTDPPYGLEFMGKEWDAPWKQAGGTVETIPDEGTDSSHPFRAGGQRVRYGGVSRGAVVNDPAAERGGFQDGNGGNAYSRSRIQYGRGGAASVGFQEWCLQWAEECFRVLKPGGHIIAFGGTRMWHRLTCAIEDAGFEIRDSLAWVYGTGFPKSRDISKDMDRLNGVVREVKGTAANYGVSTAAEGKQAYGDYAGTWDVTAPASEDAKRWAGYGTALKPGFEPMVLARKPLAARNVALNVIEHGTGALNIDGCRVGTDTMRRTASDGTIKSGNDSMAGANTGRVAAGTAEGRWPSNFILDEDQADALEAQSKGASRFFYVAKAPAKERLKIDGVAHPTVKPLSLMRHLIRLVTPPGGIVLDPFAGSGTTLEAALQEGFRCIVIERDPSYVKLIEARVDRVRQTMRFLSHDGDEVHG